MRARGRRPRSGGRGPAAAWGRGRRAPGGPGYGPRPPNCASLRLQVLVQELEQYQVCAARRRPARRVPCVPCRPCPGAARPAPPFPAPPPPAPRPAPRGGHSCASRVFAVAAEEVGLGGQRAQQELRGIGESFDISIPVFPTARPPPPFLVSCWRGEVTERRSEGAGGRPGRHRDDGTPPCR